MNPAALDGLASGINLPSEVVTVPKIDTDLVVMGESTTSRSESSCYKDAAMVEINNSG